MNKIYHIGLENVQLFLPVLDFKSPILNLFQNIVQIFHICSIFTI